MMSSETNAFSVLEGQFDGYRAVAMIRSGLRDYPDKDETPWFFGLSTALSHPTPEGLPDAIEAEDLNRWEQVIEKELCAQCKYIFVGRVSWKGHRELLFYLDAPEQVAWKMQALIETNHMRPFAFRYERDPGWTNVSVYIK